MSCVLSLVPERPASILIVVTHLLGIGHLARAAAIGRVLSQHGHRTTLVSGGRPAPLIDMGGIDLVQLPAVHCAGTDFRTLLTEDGREADLDFLAARKEQLLAV